ISKLVMVVPSDVNLSAPGPGEVVCVLAGGAVTGCSGPGSCVGWNGSSGPMKGANRDRDHESVPTGQLRPGSRRGDGHRSPGDRAGARGPSGPLSAQRAQSRLAP